MNSTKILPITIQYTSTSKKILFCYQKFLTNLLQKFNVSYSIINKVYKKKKTLLKSPHVNKRAKENFFFIRYSFKICLIKNFLIIKILKANIPKNIQLKLYYIF